MHILGWPNPLNERDRYVFRLGMAAGKGGGMPLR